jgi:PAS domain S-box-containing protein
MEIMNYNQPLRVLLVDDDEDDYILCRDMLAEIGNAQFELEWVGTDAAAREAMEGKQHDIYLLDYRFGEHTGLDLLREAKQRGCRAPMILLTGQGDHAVDVEAMQAGAADYLVKGQIDASLLERSLRYAAAGWQAEEALRESEERFRTLSASAPLGIFQTDAEGRMIYCNARCQRLTGLTSEECRDYGWCQAIHPEDRQAVLDEWSQGRREGGEFSREYRLRTPLGVEHWVSARSAPIVCGEGHLAGHVGTLEDISARKQLEEQLRQSQKMEAIGRLAGGVAHDFNNMIGAITGYADLLLQRVGADPVLRGFLEEILKAGERASALTRQLLAFGRKSAIAPQDLDLNGVVANVYQMLRRLIGEHIELVTVPDPATTPVKADPAQIEQVLLNLAINARDAMPQGGTLTITAKNVVLTESEASNQPGIRPGAYVLLAVADTGCGMDEETRARIFEPFFTTKEPGKGTGLGLATVYGIVEQSGGQIEVESQPRAGATFRIYLPRSGEARQPQQAADGPVNAVAGSETILLVEDEPVVRKMVHEVLWMNGYTVLEAIQGDDALRLWAEHPGKIDLLLTDVMMPGMSGRELAQRVTSAQPNTKVLFMSGYTDETVLRHGVFDAGTAFIQKPFRPGALAQKVRELLGVAAPGGPGAGAAVP